VIRLEGLLCDADRDLLMIAEFLVCYRFSAHYWLLDVDMNCTHTEAGWFELKTYVTDAGGSGFWESDVTQAWKCSGDVGGYRPYASSNHMARCGFVNVFVFGQGTCTIDSCTFCS